ncbi:MAG: FRG domain-containing protein [Betaproteobacteria bacterium]|nr:FRG domain-containing protein [Betaproteobacteria bacterium]
MKRHDLTVMSDYVGIVEGVRKGDMILFRGQDRNAPLLPKVARHNPEIDTTKPEQEMLGEVRRRGGLLLDHRVLADDWELLVYVQHFGMETRLLDWTSNPLVALWFACQANGIDGHTYVYVLIGGKRDVLDLNAESTPFEGSRTKILRPSLNNSRIVAQASCFTVHRYSLDGCRFVPLEKDGDFEESLIEIRMRNASHDDFLTSLNLLGVNFQTLFPDVEGLCKYVNWLHDPQRIARL